MNKFSIFHNLRVIKLFKRCLNNSSKLYRRPPNYKSQFRSNQFPFNKVYYDNDSNGPYKVVIDELTEYPPGQWGSMSVKDSWKRFKEMKHLQAIPTNLDKLLSLTWTEYNMWYHTIQMPFSYPETLQFLQYISRTKIEDSNSDFIKNNLIDISDHTVFKVCNLLKLYVQNYLDQNKPFIPSYDKESLDKQSNEFINIIMDSIILGIADHNFYKNYATAPPSLIESYIKRHGYKELNVPENVRDAEGCIHFRLRGKLAWNLRSRNPLKEFASRDDQMFVNDGQAFPIYNYHPKVFDLEPTDCDEFRNLPFCISRFGSEYLRDVPGFWCSNHVQPGDPCAFSVLGVINSNLSRKLLEQFDPAYPDIMSRHELSEALLAAFTWTVAQAHNQGYSIYDELTYPICTSMLVTNGISVQLVNYQLNSISSLWKPEDAGHPVNMMWVTPRQELFQIDNNLNEIREINVDALRQIMSSLLRPRSTLPRDQLRPFLEDRDPGNIERFIIDFDKKTASLAEIEEYKKRNVVRQLRTLPRPHPNRCFYFEMNYNTKINTQVRAIVPGIDAIPDNIGKRIAQHNLFRQQLKGKKKLLRMPSDWR